MKTKAEYQKNFLFSTSLIEMHSAHIMDQIQAFMQQTVMPFVLEQLLEIKSY